VLRAGEVPQVDWWQAREPQDGGEYYVVDGIWRCAFCSGAHAVDGHISSDKHLKNLAYNGVPLPLTALEKLGWASSWTGPSAPVLYSTPKSRCHCQPQAALPQQQQLQLMYLQPAPTPQAPPPAPPTPPGPALPPAPPTGLPPTAVPTQAPTQVPPFPPTGVPPPFPPTEATLPAPTTVAPTATGSAAVSVAEVTGMQQQVDDLKKQVADLTHRMQMMESAWASWSSYYDSDTSSDSWSNVVVEAAPPA